MFMAATLDPDYFKSKLNIFIALAPVVKMSNTLSRGLILLS
jgi:lysosomal acid lipase/cholesteryl ester hydrolase